MSVAQEIELIYTTAAAYHGVDVVLLMRKDLMTWSIRADVYRAIKELLPINEVYHYVGISKTAFERTLQMNPPSESYTDLIKLVSSQIKSKHRKRA